MNWDAIGALGEVFGAIAVVASVWYLAVQVQKQTQESKMAATRDLAAQYQSTLDLIIQDPELTAIWVVAVQDYLSLPNNDRLRVAFYLQRITRVMEAQFLHTLTENMESALFESTRYAFFEALTFPGVQQWWELSRDMFEPRFKAHVDEMIPRAREKGYNSSFKEARKMQTNTLEADT